MYNLYNGSVDFIDIIINSSVHFRSFCSVSNVKLSPIHALNKFLSDFLFFIGKKWNSPFHFPFNKTPFIHEKGPAEGVLTEGFHCVVPAVSLPHRRRSCRTSRLCNRQNGSTHCKRNTDFTIRHREEQLRAVFFRQLNRTKRQARYMIFMLLK